ncbi:MAG: Fic family protein [Candidatus Rokubacteria bacterium]|nr:Fic family protein [Candidatus Rokubacteria bacterium]
MAEPTRIPWKPIEPLPPADDVTNGALSSLDALRQEWARRLTELSEEERLAVRQRSLRRLSVETGILERLYELDWGVTLTLVAEGFTRDAVERAGGQVDDRTLATLRAQTDSLALVLDFVRQERQLTSGFIRELHHAITRTQDTYVATDTLGRITETALEKGQWKSQPNHVLRADNTLLEYVPPEHVQAEIDRLLGYWSALDKTASHPLVKAAWLHHRFVQIHPFADGNGRVARALTLLVLEKHHYAPLVVDRWHRHDYLRALDNANKGSLQDLIALFIRLEASALTSELERPPEPLVRGVALDVAHTLAAQMAEVRRRQESEVQARLTARAIAVGGRLRQWFEQKRAELVEVFKTRGLNDVIVSSNTEMPPSERTHWFRRQIVESAQVAGHYADFRTFSGWASLRIRTDRWRLRYVASLHGAGQEPGIMAVTTFAEIEPYPAQDGDEGTAAREHLRTTIDAFRFVHTEGIDEISRRSVELERLLDDGLSVALAEMMKKL